MTTTHEPLIDAARVEAIAADCLGNDTDPEDRVTVQGIVNDYAFKREKLEEHRPEIETMLRNLPIEFRAAEHGGGGGWSFLNALDDANGVQWTGLHWTMEQLLCLGIALGAAAWLLPKELWGAFPGGMPYVVVKV